MAGAVGGFGVSDEAIYCFEDVQDLILEKAIPHAEEIKFDASNDFQFHIVTLYASSLELAWACLALIEQRLGYFSWITLRSFLEAYIEVKNLINDESYLQHRELENEKTSLLQLRHAKDGNRYFRLIAKDPKLDEKIDIHKASVLKLKNAGVDKLSIERKFELAGEKEIYDGLYRMLSKHVHPNKAGLISRHVDFEHDPPKLKAMDHGGFEDFGMVTHYIYQLILGLSQVVHHHFGTGLEGKFDLMNADSQ